MYEKIHIVIIQVNHISRFITFSCTSLENNISKEQNNEI